MTELSGNMTKKRAMELIAKHKAGVRYLAGQGARYNDEQAQKIGLACEAIEKKKGFVSTQDIVDAGQDKASVFYSLLEHDPDTGLRQWQKKQAVDILNHLVRLEVKGERVYEKKAQWNIIRQVDIVPASAASSLPQSQGRANETYGLKCYNGSRAVMSDAELRKQVVDGARRELVNWADKYGRENLPELSGLVALIRANVKPASGK